MCRGISAVIPETSGDGYRVRVIAGGASPVRLHTPVLYLDVTLAPGAVWEETVPATYRGFIYVLGGVGRFGTGGTEVEAGRLLVLGDGAAIRAEVAAGEAMRFTLIAGQPHGELIRLRGPYVD